MTDRVRLRQEARGTPGVRNSRVQLPCIRAVNRVAAVERNDLSTQSANTEEAFITTSTLAVSTATTQAGNKKLRLLVSREEKLRGAFAEEESQERQSLLHQEGWSRSAIAAFVRCRQRSEAVERRHKAADSMWSSFQIGDEIQRTVASEVLSRAAIMKREGEQRRTLQQLSVADLQPIWSRHRVAALAEAERVRRSFLYRDEVREALNLGIPGFEPGYVFVPRDADSSCCTALEKIDYLKHQCCPYASAEECPFFPPNVRYSLERCGLTARSLKTPPAQSRQLVPVTSRNQQSGSRALAPDHTITPVKRRQRVSLADKNAALFSLRAALRKGHYAAASSAALTAMSQQ